MKLSRGFLENVRIMVHTLVEHMGRVGSNPWEATPVLGEDRCVPATQKEASALTDELDQMLVLSLKLTHQLVRTHKLIGTGNSVFSNLQWSI